MTVSGAWSRYRRARPPKSPRLGRWQQVLADALDQTLRLAYEQPSLIISVESPLVLSSLLLDEPPTVSPRSVVPACFTCPGADADADAGDRDLSGAGEAERDHERHPPSRGGGWGEGDNHYRAHPPIQPPTSPAGNNGSGREQPNRGRNGWGKRSVVPEPRCSPRTAPRRTYRGKRQKSRSAAARNSIGRIFLRAVRATPSLPRQPSQRPALSDVYVCYRPNKTLQAGPHRR